MTQYLKPDTDIEMGPVWSLDGSAPAATVWESLDGDSGANPPTSDSDVDYVKVNNASLPSVPGQPIHVYVGMSSPTGDPVRHTGHVCKWIWRRAGSGSFVTWPKFKLYQAGIEIASFTNTDPGTTYTTISKTLTEEQAAQISDYTALEFAWEDPDEGSGSCACRLTTAWMELPPAWSTGGDAEGDSEATCAASQTAAVRASAEGDSEGVCAASASVAARSAAEGDSEATCSASAVTHTVVAAAEGDSEAVCSAAVVTGDAISSAAEGNSEANCSASSVIRERQKSLARGDGPVPTVFGDAGELYVHGAAYDPTVQGSSDGDSST